MRKVTLETVKVKNMNPVTQIYLKTTEADKQLLVKAATVCHQSLTEFMLQAAHERLQKILQSQDSMMLSNAEWERFQAFLNTPDEPNAVLQAAAREYLKEFHQ